MKLCIGRGHAKSPFEVRDGMIVVVETNAARTVKFAKQMPLVDASAGAAIGRGNHVSL